MGKGLTWPHTTKSGKLKMPASLNPHIHTKELRYQLIPSRDIDDQGILQSDWVCGKTGHTQPRVVESDPAFP